jgi:CO/xanthine dehydrogenase FAD-binding subunit
LLTPGFQIFHFGIKPLKSTGRKEIWMLPSVDAAFKAAAEGISILGDHYASEQYRKHLAKVYLKRALVRLL